MPRIHTPVPPVSRNEVFLATDRTRWEFVVEAVKGPIPGTECWNVASRSPEFAGGVSAARDHANRLADVGVLERVKTANRVSYRLGDKGKAIYARMIQLQHARPFRAPAETRLVALVARLDDPDYEAFGVEEKIDLELVAELRGRATTTARQLQVVEP